jgi:hypothetical protein
MEEGKHWSLAVFWALFIAVVVIGGVVGFAESLGLGRESLCGPGQCTVQAWLGALSGYFAFVAAAITAWFIFGQVAEARRQTAFMLGDADPVAAIHEDFSVQNPGDAFANRLVVTNFNRRPIYVTGVREASATGLEIFEVTVASTKDPYADNPKARQWESGRLFVEGWLDRAKPPPEQDFMVVLAERGDGSGAEVEFVRRQAASLIVDIVVLDHPPRKVAIEVSSPFAIAL